MKCTLVVWQYWHKYWNPYFACWRKPHSCTIQRHQALKIRWPGLLLQAAFFLRCQTTGCLFWPLWPLRALIRLHGVPNWFWRQTWPTLWVVPVWVTYWWQSTALWVWMFALPRLRLPTHPTTHPLQTQSVLLQQLKKNHLKNQGHSNS